MSLPPLFPRNGSAQTLFPKGWDRVVIGGLPLPGKASISGGGIALKADPKERNGGNGGTPTFSGLEAQRFQVKVTVVTQEQLDELARVCSLILPLPGSSFAGQSTTIESPQLDVLGCVTSVVVTGASPIARSNSGGAEMTLNLMHWLPAQAAKTKGKTAKKTPKAQRKVSQNVPNAIVGEGTVLRQPETPSSDPLNFAAPGVP